MALSKHDSHNGPRSSFLYYILTPPFINHEKFVCLWLRSVWRYQRGNQNPYIEEEQTTQWPKEKVQKDKQRSTKHKYKTKDRVPRTPPKPGSKLRCSGRVSSTCSNSDTRLKIPKRQFRSRKSKKDRQCNCQNERVRKDKKLSAKHYTKN